MNATVELGGSYMDTYDTEFGWGEKEFKMARETSEDKINGMQLYQTLWSWPSSNNYRETWSRMVRQGNAINYEFHDYDEEDGRAYDYRGTFSVDDYRTAINQIKKGGATEIQGEGGRLSMCNDSGIVRLTFSGESSEQTPGGRQVSGSQPHVHKLEELILLE